MPGPLGPPWSYSAPAGLARPRRQTVGVGWGAAPEGASWEPCGKQPVLKFRLSPHGHASRLCEQHSTCQLLGWRRPTTGPGIQCPGHRGRPCPSPRSTHPTSESRELQLPRPTAWENTACRQDPIYVQVVMCVHRTNFLCTAGFQITFTLYYVFLNVLIAHSITFIII